MTTAEDIEDKFLSYLEDNEDTRLPPEFTLYLDWDDLVDLPTGPMTVSGYTMHFRADCFRNQAAEIESEIVH